MELIDKSALVAEIEKFIERAKAERVLLPKTILAAKNYLLIEDYNKLLSFINTLEVKEVDLEKEIEKCLKQHNMLAVGRKDFTDIAKHFFELGLKVNYSITAADRGTAEEIIINLKRVEHDYRINLTKEIDWVRNQIKKGSKGMTEIKAQKGG